MRGAVRAPAALGGQCGFGKVSDRGKRKDESCGNQ
ncbi:hypothetical protein IMSAGC003_02812 [Lachnospiraceae bacterium]|nr:hypothetical protein IMSAGC003_02812 [Lachnospiraceae bacterium]